MKQVRVSITLLGCLTLCSTQTPQSCSDCIQQSRVWCPVTNTCEDSSTTCSTSIKLLLNCPRSPNPAYAYNETFTRYYITPLVAAVHAKSPATCLKYKLTVLS